MRRVALLLLLTPFFHGCRGNHARNLAMEAMRGGERPRTDENMATSAAPRATGGHTDAVPSSDIVLTPMQSSAPPTSMGGWDQRITRLYNSYSRDSKVRTDTYRELFAPKVRRYIGLRDVSIEKVISVVDKFLRAHPNPHYATKGKVEVSQGKIGRSLSACVDATWDEACPSDWARENWTCQRQQYFRMEAETDAQGLIVEFNELALPNDRYRALVELRGYDEPHSTCDDEHTLPASSIEIGKDTIVKATGRSIVSFGCGPCESIREFVYNETTFWAVDSTCFRIYDEATGPHTGFDSFLEKLDVDNRRGTQ